MTKEIAFQFAEWLGENYVKLHGTWVHRFSSQLDQRNWKPTKDLFEKFKAKYGDTESIEESFTTTSSVIQNDKEDSILLRCECGTHIALLQEPHEKGDDEYIFAFYNYGLGEHVGIWNRIKKAFKYIFTAKGFANEIIIKRDQVDKLQEFISKK
ncbi:MAG: hypothetical protein ACI9J3_003298 [Parvicellaceae bacterium]|jgi:hypothetical protein